MSTLDKFKQSPYCDLVLFSVKKDAILSFLSKTNKVVNSKPLIPCLTGIKIEAVGDTITLSATDLTISLSATLDAKVIEEGLLVVDADRLRKSVGVLPGPDICFTLKQELYIESGKSKFKLNLLAHENFPRIPTWDALSQIDANVFIQTIESTLFAVSQTPSNQALTGLYLEVWGDVFYSAGMSTGWLVTKDQTKGEGDLFYTVLLPHKGAVFLQSVLDKKMNLSCDKEKDIFFLQQGPFSYSIKTMDETHYPKNFKNLLKTTHKWSVSIDCQDLINSLDRAMILGGTTGVRLKFTEDNLFLSSAEVGFGESSDEIDIWVEESTSKPLLLVVNGKFLLEVIERLSKEEKKCTLQMGGSEDPILLKAGQMFVVIMPQVI